MTMPERGTPEWIATQDRVHRAIMDITSNVAVRRKNLPPQAHVIIHDEVTGERFGAYVGIQYINDSGMARITRTSIGMLAPGVSPTRIADGLIKNHPDTPLICDDIIANELAKEQKTITWLEEDHYRLEGRPGGVLEIYTPFDAQKVPGRYLPRGVSGVQIYKE